MLLKTRPIYLVDSGHPQARACMSCAVRGHALFGALDSASLERIHTHIAAPTLQPEEAVYSRGQHASAVFTIRCGVVRFERITEAGDRRIVRLAGRGDLIGLEALLDATYADDALTCTPVELCRIPTSLVDQLGKEQQGLLQELMRRWQRALVEAETWTAELSAGPARRRVLELLRLLDRHADDQGRIWMPTREVIGDMLDITEETASRVISQLRREGLFQGEAMRQARVHREKLMAALAAP